MRICLISNKTYSDYHAKETRLLLVSLLLSTSVAPLRLLAQVADRLLDSVTVTAQRITSPLRASTEEVVFNMSGLDDLPKILGNADPLHYSQLMPGIQTSSEFDAGIHIQGCENMHNLISINDVPIYNPSHMLGFFSVFNGSHYKSMTLNRYGADASTENRLGGKLDMNTFAEPLDSTSGEFAVGLISSQGTLKLPISKKTSIVASLRGSYLNLLYSKWLELNGNPLGYSFFDSNLSLIHRADSRNTLYLDYFGGWDNLKVSEDVLLSDIKLKWGNIMVSGRWQHKGTDFSSNTTAYYTRYHNNLSIISSLFGCKGPSDISDIGIKHSTNWKRFNLGTDIIFHDIQPQSPEITNDAVNISQTEPRLRSQEISIYAKYTQSLSEKWSFDIGLRGNAFFEDNSWFSVDPSANIKFQPTSTWNLQLNYGWKHQYLVQTGLSHAGLPCEFWFPTGYAGQRPQYMQNVSLISVNSFRGGQYKLSADVYYRRLYNQSDLEGTIFTILNQGYNLENMLLRGHGYNCGFNIILSKQTGRLTGWVGYSFTHSQRKIPAISQSRYFPSRHERQHELDAVATYSLNRRWSFGANLVAASGLPYTGVESFYIIERNLYMCYSDYNSKTMAPYIRLDLSANYKLTPRHCKEHGINFSLYNATATENDLFVTLKYNRKRQYKYGATSFIKWPLPSVSYYIKF